MYPISITIIDLIKSVVYKKANISVRIMLKSHINNHYPKMHNIIKKFDPLL